MAMEFKRLLVAVGLATLLGVSPLGAQTVYKHVDEQGNVSFSDAPQSDTSEEVEVRTSTGIRLPQPRQRIDPPGQQSRSGQTADDSSRYRNLTITRPEHDTAFWRTSGEVTIQVTIDPALRSGHRLQLELDGKKKPPQQGNSFSFQNMDRGTHEVIAHVVDSNGEIIQSSELTRFTVHRHSILNNPSGRAPRPGAGPGAGN
ncbi:MAG: DUF4124 domain-containing protein [Halomonadaceae bacterium]|nr:MAG: DUF4124 domain-containing protein [Halomonadaceae bacterium]